MQASYWVAKYVDDPFRNEPRNVGVIVCLNDSVAARFVGERDDGTFDARKIGKQFSYPGVYSQWRRYWRGKLRPDAVAGLTKQATPNYFVQAGGEVTDTGGDSAADVCQFLYSLLVSGTPVDAYEWAQEDESEVDLAADIADAFAESKIMATSTEIFIRHPVEKEARVAGLTVTHVPSFSQRNGVLYIIEHIDLSTPRVNKAKERAGWMAYMFSDIGDRNPDTKAFSIIRPAQNDAAGQIEYAKTVLSSTSDIINWSDEAQRGRFLEDRARVAEHI